MGISIGIREFVELVFDMRHSQKRYFSVRSKDNLIRSKVLEGKVDKTCNALMLGDLFREEGDGVRVAVVEWRERGGDGWAQEGIYLMDGREEWRIVNQCERLSVLHPGREHRYRLATLTFDDDGHKCVIY